MKAILALAQGAGAFDPHAANAMTSLVHDANTVVSQLALEVLCCLLQAAACTPSTELR